MGYTVQYLKALLHKEHGLPLSMVGRSAHVLAEL